MATSPAAAIRTSEILAPRPSPSVGRALWRFVRKNPLGAACALITAVSRGAKLKALAEGAALAS